MAKPEIKDCFNDPEKINFHCIRQKPSMKNSYFDFEFEDGNLSSCAMATYDYERDVWYGTIFRADDDEADFDDGADLPEEKLQYLIDKLTPEHLALVEEFKVIYAEHSTPNTPSM